MKKFDDHKYAQAWIDDTRSDGATLLISYRTVVIVVTPDGWLHCTGTYSATTRRHIGWFMRLYGLSYHTAKALYETETEMNIHTGEVRPL